MDNNTLEEFVEVLEIFINHHNSGDEFPLSPKELKKQFGIYKLKSKTQPYYQKQRSLERILDFYSSIKLVSMITDTTMNEIGRLESLRGKRFTPIDERKQLDPYIELVSFKRKKSSQKTPKCKKFNLVNKFKEYTISYKDDKGNEYTEEEIKDLVKTPLVLNYPNMDKKGYRTVLFGDNPKSNLSTKTEVKLKEIDSNKTVYEFYGNKFQNIKINVKKDSVDEDKNGKKIPIQQQTVLSLSNDIVIISNEDIQIVDIDDSTVRAEDLLYRLTTNCDKGDFGVVKYKLPSNDNIVDFVNFLRRNIKKIGDEYESNITEGIVSKVIRSNAFGFQSSIIPTDEISKEKQIKRNEEIQRRVSTLGKISLENYNKGDGLTKFTALSESAYSKIKVDIEILLSENIVKLNDTVINSLTINGDSFDIDTENFVSKNHKSIDDIVSIKNSESISSEELEELQIYINTNDEQYGLLMSEVKEEINQYRENL